MRSFAVGWITIKFTFRRHFFVDFENHKEKSSIALDRGHRHRGVWAVEEHLSVYHCVEFFDNLVAAQQHPENIDVRTWWEDRASNSSSSSSMQYFLLFGGVRAPCVFFYPRPLHFCQTCVTTCAEGNSLRARPPPTGDWVNGYDPCRHPPLPNIYWWMMSREPPEGRLPRDDI